jgi:hypothetical protein
MMSAKSPKRSAIARWRVRCSSLNSQNTITFSFFFLIVASALSIHLIFGECCSSSNKDCVFAESGPGVSDQKRVPGDTREALEDYAMFFRHSSVPMLMYITDAQG